MAKKKNPLASIRTSIDALDSKIVQLLNQRAQQVLKIGEIKTKDSLHFYAPHREIQVYRRVTRLNKGPFPTKHFIRFTGRSCPAPLPRVATQDCLFRPIRDQHTHCSAGKIREFRPLHSGRLPERCFFGSGEGKAHYGVVPIENSTKGTINHTLIFLWNRN